MPDVQFGFRRQKSTTDAAMEAKKFIETELEKSRNNDQPLHHRSLRRSVVAKHPKGVQRFRLPYKSVLPQSRIL
jgi:hypothetical protein